MNETAHQRARLANRITGLKPSLYARIMSKLALYDEEVYPFHIGETHLAPPVVVSETFKNADNPDLHHYGHPQGDLLLREGLAAYLRRHGMPDVGPHDVVVTHGATHGLSLACQAILDPGDVMLVLSPHWPLVNSMVQTASAVPIEVPFTCRLRQEGKSPYEILARSLQPRTRAIYLTSPNNPDGVVLTRDELAEVARFCVDHNLYALVDEAYDRFHFGERPPRLSSFEGMEELAISIFTFSKSHRMAGIRVGYTVAPPDVRNAMIKLANISIYNVSHLAQRAALVALNAGEEYVEETASSALRARDQLSGALLEVEGVSFSQPEGGAYIFADLGEVLRGRDCFDLLDRCLDAGVVFAPGQGFGQAYERYARFCFTAMDPDHLARGTARLAEVLARYRKTG